jgi:hypothetical protein
MAAELKTVTFYGTCGAGAELTLVSKRISTPFRTKAVHATFPLGTLNLLLMRCYVSPDDEAPAAGAPSGVSMLRDYGQVDYLAGDATKKEILHEVHIAEAGAYLKVYATNADFFDHAVDVQIMIETY